MTTEPVPDAVAVDRLRELASIGAGHAATALARLLGETVRMRVPNAAALVGEAAASAAQGSSGWPAGVFIEFRGGVGGVAAMLLSAAGRDHLIDKLLGRPRTGASAVEVESALCEVGNVLLSSLVSAIANTLGISVMPTTPILASSDASALFDAVTAERRAALAGVRIESELLDDAGGLRALLVWVPGREATSRAKASCLSF